MTDQRDKAVELDPTLSTEEFIDHVLDVPLRQWQLDILRMVEDDRAIVLNMQKRYSDGDIRADFNELEQLRRWKREATAVIEAWEKCFEDLKSWGYLPELGEFKSAFVQRWIRKTLMEREK